MGKKTGDHQQIGATAGAEITGDTVAIKRLQLRYGVRLGQSSPVKKNGGAPLQPLQPGRPAACRHISIRIHPHQAQQRRQQGALPIHPAALRLTVCRQPHMQHSGKTGFRLRTRAAKAVKMK